jgi:hypothetical protein
MRLQYIVTKISGPIIAGRAINESGKIGIDGLRRMFLDPSAAKSYIDAGWLVLDDTAPPSPIEQESKAEYDFKGSVIRNARPPVNRYTANHELSGASTDSDKGALVIVNNASDATVTLPNDWDEGEGCIIRRTGAGNVMWSLKAGSSSALPSSRSSHTKIAERHSEIMVRVIANADGKSAVWSIEGPTA